MSPSTKFFISIWAMLVGTSLAQTTQPIAPSPVTGSGCALLANQHIYCFGGAQSATSNRTMNNILLSLDVSNYNYDTPTFSWQQVTSANQLAADMSLDMVPINNGSSFLILEPSRAFGAAPPIVVGNPSANQYTNFSFPNPGNAGFYVTRSYASVVDLSSAGQSQVWIFGGESEAVFNGGPSIAPPNIIMFNYVSNQFSTINPPTPNGLTRYGHTATLTGDGSEIYVVGGFKALTATSTTWTNITYLNTLWIFSMNSSQWSSVQPSSTSNTLPSDRSLHTTTLIPGSSYFFIYGGVSTNLQNYCKTMFIRQGDRLMFVSLRRSGERSSVFIRLQHEYIYPGNYWSWQPRARAAKWSRCRLCLR
ncbi:hypothetical protein DM01DRAFT_1043252 [Hesseltinella vesiculosa]|uniref:Galactose oxidase n=1 Tax=Hesseltinella vesiculosa TaxID=101127 RepID=A0A1X2GHQ5_9FUNG|nr:hypothetical protein DM01DRAFT_1043252 [Hesseltinella vesiculosa]